MRILPEAIDVSNQVAKKLVDNGGRAADGGISLPFLGSMVAAAGDGHHCDIGTLYGASALTAALVKQKMKFDGLVYCIDPYDKETRDAKIQPQAGIQGNVSATPEEFWKNVDDFGVRDRIRLVQKPSHPWPDELKDVVFASAYIDGDHIGRGPWNDFENLRGRTTGYIGADNVEEEYPDVVDAMLRAADTDDWFCYYKNITFMALRRVHPSRTTPWHPGFLLTL